MNRRPSPFDRVRVPRPSPELRASVLAAARARRLEAPAADSGPTRSEWLATAWLLLAAAILAGHLTLDWLAVREAGVALGDPFAATMRGEDAR